MSEVLKFDDPQTTTTGAVRAHVAFEKFDTVWVNTGTLCNIECANCYIGSSPTNDRLAYFTKVDLAPFLDEARELGAREIGFTGGEPFLNPEMTGMINDALEAEFSVLVLTNAMRPMMRPAVCEALLACKHRERISFRVSLDHYTPGRHDKERGAGAFAVAMKGIAWLVDQGFNVSLAGRSKFGEDDTALRASYAQSLKTFGIDFDAHDPKRLILFPEMDDAVEPPEITEDCWGILGVDPRDMMCATSRMVVKHKGRAQPSVLACTLLTRDERFNLGTTLAQSRRPVSLNHRYCAQFCVLGGASCSG